jgi:hypothetical protein
LGSTRPKATVGKLQERFAFLAFQADVAHQRISNLHEIAADMDFKSTPRNQIIHPPAIATKPHSHSTQVSAIPPCLRASSQAGAGDVHGAARFGFSLTHLPNYPFTHSDGGAGRTRIEMLLPSLSGCPLFPSARYQIAHTPRAGFSHQGSSGNIVLRQPPEGKEPRRTT